MIPLFLDCRFVLQVGHALGVMAWEWVLFSAFGLQWWQTCWRTLVIVAHRLRSQDYDLEWSISDIGFPLSCEYGWVK
jgi:hypothetical protein